MAFRVHRISNRNHSFDAGRDPRLDFSSGKCAEFACVDDTSAVPRPALPADFNTATEAFRAVAPCSDRHIGTERPRACRSHPAYRLHLAHTQLERMGLTHTGKSMN